MHNEYNNKKRSSQFTVPHLMGLCSLPLDMLLHTCIPKPPPLPDPTFTAISAWPEGSLDFLRHLSGGHDEIAYAVGKKPCVYTDVACF